VSTRSVSEVLRHDDPSDLTDEQWALLEPVFNAPGKPGAQYAVDLQTRAD